MEKSRAIELLEHLAWDRDIERNPYGDALNMAIEALKAQLSKEGTTSDLISRQAAIEKVRTMQTYKLFMGDDMILVDKAEVQTELMMLPSVQPEVLACGNGELVAQPEPQWIPVERELPEDFTDVLVWFEYFRYGNYNRMCATHGIGNYSKGYNSWTINHETGWKDLHVFAWMPLPIPYQKGAIK